MYLYKHPKELKENKTIAGRIINEWSRPIFNLSTDFKTLTKEERMARDEMLEAKRKAEERNEEESGLRPGDPGWCYRARVPQIKTSTYVNRPEWTSQVDISRGKVKQTSRMDKHVRNMAERKKNAKTRRAVEISVEGRKMNL
jgi:transcription factor SPN1